MNLENILPEVFVDTMIFILTIPVPIWKFTVPFWGVLLGVFVIGCISNSFKRHIRAFR